MKKNGAPRIFRILLHARDLDQSRRFFETLLAIPGRRVHGGRVYFDAGPVILGLLDASADDRPLPPPPTEALYFATRDLDGLHERARRLGCLSSELIHTDPANPAGEMVARPWGERSFYAEDPSGNPLCFVNDRTLFMGTLRQVATLGRTTRPRTASRPKVRASRTHARPRTRPRP